MVLMMTDAVAACLLQFSQRMEQILAYLSSAYKEVDEILWSVLYRGAEEWSLLALKSSNLSTSVKRR